MLCLILSFSPIYFVKKSYSVVNQSGVDPPKSVNGGGCACLFFLPLACAPFPFSEEFSIEPLSLPRDGHASVLILLRNPRVLMSVSSVEFVILLMTVSSRSQLTLLLLQIVTAGNVN